MSYEEIKSNLCYYDRDNPNNNLDAYDEEDRPQPRNGCGCDNCFYGRDKLAMQILETQRERDEAREEWGKASMDAAQLLSEKTKAIAERDEAIAERDRYKRQWEESRMETVGVGK